MTEVNWKTRRDTHDYFDDALVANFLRNHNTGVNNIGRMYLAKLIQTYDNPAVLDVACGTCVNWEVFKLLRAKCTYTGFDRTRKLLNHAKLLYGDDIKLVEGHAQELLSYFPVNSQDIVVIRHLLEHLPEGKYEEVVRQAFAIAQKELVIVFFVEPNDTADDLLKENGPDERGCYYWWNSYSMSKFLGFIDSIGGQLLCAPTRVETPGAAAPDVIFRIGR